MTPDPVVEEIRKYREELAARFNYDIEALVRYARERDLADDRIVVKLPPRRVVPESSPQPEAVTTTP